MCKGLGLWASKRQTSELVKDLKLSRQRDAVSKSALLKLASLMTFFIFAFSMRLTGFFRIFSGVATQLRVQDVNRFHSNLNMRPAATREVLLRQHFRYLT